ncbi:phosphoribosylanthranilate isomerase [Fulvivirga sediminis]|uniref:N-(5'-phosphoribosyl)anthranilate isomerase n=1 Tax=Fulvivirga sediminis TaxID=2803949 RepID=A0A937FDC5_9BACT|nr:phosphoribosylanthranilate isomerase [Fulvivirga sediminis]MBL3658684.1 phosphoribosylanthranilate isomerase [Fulvivirga sediminis]
MPKLKDIKLKVCGLRDNIDEVIALKPDYVGFIFYDKSPRFVGDLDPRVLHDIPNTIKKIGVFVNEDIEEVLHKVKTYRLDLVQLHGYETVEYCAKLKEEGVQVIKVFSGNNDLDWMEFKVYEEVVDFFLFDTRTDKYGGSGKSFDWSRLEKVHLSKPVFISGGVNLDNIEKVSDIQEVHIHAVDVNSKFEISPGLKNINLLKQLKEKMLCDTV